MILAVHLKEKMIVPDVPNNPTQESQESQNHQDSREYQEGDVEKESEKNTDGNGIQLSNEQESDVLDDEDALTETSEEDDDSEDGLVIGDLL